MMLRSLKKKYLEEVKAFISIKKNYPHLATMSDDDILSYFECSARGEIVKLVEDLKSGASGDNNFAHENYADETICTCRNSDGNIKNLYLNKEDAERMSVFLSKEQNITLTIYVCPTSSGWHLTKM